ncbi:TerD family protein [Salipiger marinus]|uniref:Tellurium resistance protein TerZ n=1 Tax=Salipiger marinus TaxID=555512 RepID=A0A1G8UKF3_9RHOB|nr:TerD family protein [Salipiger marinus]SDJ53967.1 tellurium resistance protein TerZ [Salipiger marinus]
MAISLTKGQSISLEKGGKGLTRVFMGLGWDPVKKGGFLGGLLGGGGGGSIDLDASVIVFDAQKKALETVWFRNLKSSDGAIRHGGDNLTGEGDGDDEVIHVDLDRLDSRAAHLVFTVNSFRGQTFNEVDNAFARLVDATNKSELCRYTLAERGKHTGVIMAAISKTGSGWQMKAIGHPGRGSTVNDMAADAVALI